ncbi:MAG TPA: hypothetical protein VKA49_05470 [Flavitalea sp.]|nr:hypothetical protein [Flavitalea sp.]
MNKLTASLFLLLVAASVSVHTYCQIQPTSKWIFDIGPSIAFATKAIANNDAGIGILGGIEKNIYKNISCRAETGFTYFFGDKSYSVDGKNKAYTIPLLAEIKVYFLSQFYVSPRAGAIYFLLNDQSKSHVQLAYGFTAGCNLPKKSNRINIQAGYTGFSHDDVHRGYATLGAAIIIN